MDDRLEIAARLLAAANGRGNYDPETIYDSCLKMADKLIAASMKHEFKLIPDEELLSMPQIERNAIVKTLRAVNGNREMAAKILDMGERTLYRKLADYRIEESETIGESNDGR